MPDTGTALNYTDAWCTSWSRGCTTSSHIDAWCTATLMPGAQHWAAILMPEAQHWASAWYKQQSNGPSLMLIAEQEPAQCMLHCMPTWCSVIPSKSMVQTGSAYLNWVHKVWFGKQAHAQDIHNGIVVDGMKGDLCHSLRTVVFHTNSNICFVLYPTRSAMVVSEWS